ncbi:NmrA family transcriptional regulator, partial [Azospirillum brasilense]|nr:NmrA family transcriptional regulator [Azospirillum brasilense]
PPWAARRFFEVLGGTAQWATGGGEIPLSPALVPPTASDGVVAALAEVALASPVNGTLEVAGPEAIPLDELVRRFLQATNDTRKVVPDIHARYFGDVLNDQSLTAGRNPRLGAIRFEDWLGRQTVR